MQIEMKIVPLTTRRQLLTAGNWVNGTLTLTIGKSVKNFRFQALAFDEHADCDHHELGRSKIAKLWIQNTGTKQTVFSFDRGHDLSAKTKEIQALADFVEANLASAKK